MIEHLNPDDFVIIRRRKKYKFAKFHNAENCFEFDEWRDLCQYQQPAVSMLEIGAGTGMFSVELAQRHPDKIFAAVDVKGDRLQKGAYAALEQDLKNVFFVRARADQIDELISPKSLENIWITFPDPFPKKRSAGRRLTHPYFLRISALSFDLHESDLSGEYKIMTTYERRWLNEGKAINFVKATC